MRVVVVDDGSSAGALSLEEEVFADVAILRQGNLGVATALNRGIEAALVRWPDTDFILTVDQDSEIGPLYIDRAVAAYFEAKANGAQVGAVSAAEFNDRPVARLKTTIRFPATLEVAQSGMLFPRATFAKFGLFDADLFIDCVDTDYALRMHKGGYIVLLAQGCKMSHEVGTVYPVRLFGKPIVVRGRTVKYSYHSAIRRYYISRNRVVIYRRYFWVAPLWNLRDLFAEACTATFSLLLGDGKARQLAAIALGVSHGIRGRLGEAPPTAKKLLGML